MEDLSELRLTIFLDYWHLVEKPPQHIQEAFDFCNVKLSEIAPSLTRGEFRWLQNLRDLQVDPEHARKLFKGIVESIGENKTTSLVSLLIAVGNHCVHTMKLATGRIPKDASAARDARETDLYVTVHNFVKKYLFDPVPTYHKEKPNSFLEGQDHVISRDLESLVLPKCPITGTTAVDTTHVIKGPVAGAESEQLWFWLFLALLVPQNIWEFVWNLCGGDNRHADDNIILLNKILHHLFDELVLSFRLHKTNDPDILKLEILEIDRQRASLSALRSREFTELKHGDRLTYKRHKPYP